MSYAITKKFRRPYAVRCNFVNVQISYRVKYSPHFCALAINSVGEGGAQEIAEMSLIFLC